MIDLRTVIRPMLAAPFVIGAVNTLKAPQASAERAADVVLPIADAVGLPKDPEMLVKLNAGIQIGAGVLLAMGVAPRLTALVLGGSLVPTTLAAHRFWEETEPGTRSAQMVHFAKNAGLLGGLLAAALDTGGRPSVLWASRRAVENAAHAVADTVSSAVQALPGVS
jgi:uncharacterized membrane protein YphA (DoxX/SURF4 family)